MGMRLQKVLAQAGLASRREAEQWIQAGRISVNGKVVTALGTQADPAVDRIAVDGKVINRLEPKVYYLLNKPTGYVSTCEDELGLDWDSEGLLLLTNDGELAQRLLHPRFHIRRTYLAKVEGIPTAQSLRRLTHTGDPSAPQKRRPSARISRVGERHAWLEIRLWEGQNRQVRRMCEAVGHPVKRLRRVQFAGLDTMGLSSGQYRPLTLTEVHALKRLAGLEPPSKRVDQAR
jgi:23S rRNA pseudouridine2605 synthase